MKALIICPAFCNQSETFIYAMQEKLKDFQVSVLCYDRRNADVFPFDASRITTLRGRPVQEYLISQGWSSGGSPEPDIIHAQYTLSAKLAYGIKKYFGNRPKVILHVHGQDFYVPYKQGRLSFLRKAIRGADLILTPSIYVKQRIQNAFPERQSIEAYYTAINEADYPYSGPPALTKEISILMVGRLVEKKGYLTALQALAQLPVEYKLKIIGQGPLREKLDSLVNVLGLAARVQFCTVKENTDVRKMFLASHIFWAPSEVAANGDEEGLPRTVTEALALGIAVIGTTHAGIPEAIIHKKTGLLCPEKDPQALALATLWAIKNWPEMVKYAEFGRQHFAAVFGIHRQNTLAPKYPEPIKSFLKNLES